RKTAERQRHGIVLAGLRHPFYESRDFGKLLRPVRGPAIQLAPKVAISRHAVGGGKVSIELNGFVEQHQVLVVALPGPSIKARRRPEKVVVGIKAFSRLVPRTLDFGLLQFRRNRADNARSDLVLQIEDVIERAIEAIRPQVTTSGGVDQLSGDSH